MDDGVHHLLDEVSQPAAGRVVYKALPSSRFLQIIGPSAILTILLYKPFPNMPDLVYVPIPNLLDFILEQTTFAEDVKRLSVMETVHDQYWNQAIHLGVNNVGARLEQRAYKHIAEKGSFGYHTSR